MRTATRNVTISDLAAFRHAEGRGYALRVKKIRRRRRVPVWTAPAACGIVAMVLPMLFGLLIGFQEPKIQDEFSYLLGADTFARGRLANGAPELPRFFESEHILVTPVYQTKYPPGQSLMLAFGQVVFGHPIWGVWVSCGIFAASLVWMLQLWTSRAWAVAVTVLATLTLGTNSYWAQSYWGGMLTGAGGALVMGAVRNILVAPGVLSGLLLGLGILLLGTTRPYDGALFTGGAMVLLLQRLVIARRGSARRRVAAVALPVGVIVGLGVAATIRYSLATTGKPLLLPYQLHVQQYHYGGIFIFSSPLTPERNPPERVRELYLQTAGTSYQGAEVLVRLAYNFGFRLPFSFAAPFVMIMPLTAGQPYCGVLLWVLLLPSIWRRRSIASLTMLAVATTAGELLLWRYLLLYPWLLIPFVLPVVWLQLDSDRPRGPWWRWWVAILLLTVLGQSLVQWWLPHYTAAIFPLIFAGLASALRRQSSRLGARAARRLPRVLAILVAAQLAALTISGTAMRHLPKPHTVREAVKTQLLEKPGAHLVFVTYDRRYDLNLEWVYNDADLVNTRVLFAHDLGAAENRSLIRSNSGRVVWRLAVSPESVRLEPYE